jgi:ABC-type branched-subunit amino acid transport system substrate-binding protein
MTGEHPTVRTNRVLVGLTAAILAVVTVSACDSAQSSSTTGATGSSATSSATSTTSASGSTINVMGFGTLQSAVVSVPDAAPAMQARVDEINAAGGIGGHKINLIICDDQNDPNTAASCGREAVSDKAVAVLIPFSNNSAQILPILAAANIPAIYNAALSPADETSPNSFPRDAGVMGIYGGLGQQLAKEGCTKVGAVVLSIPPTLLGAQWLQTGLKSKNVPMVSVQVGLTQASFSASVSQLISEGADCIVPVTAPQQGSEIALAIQQAGKKVKIGAVDSEFSATQIKSLGSALNGTILTGAEYLPSDTDVPAIAAYLAGMKKYEPNVTPASAFSIDSWASVNALQHVLANVSGPVTGSSVMAAAAKTTTNTGLLAPFSWASQAPSAKYPRVQDYSYLTWTVNNGTMTLNPGGFSSAASLAS